jgi:hypothetical protein
MKASPVRMTGMVLRATVPLIVPALAPVVKG